MTRIALATAVWGDVPYFAYSGAANSAYCRRHGYDWRVVDFTPDALPADRAAHWAKVQAVEQVLPDYDAVLFLDADAWVYDPDKTVEGHLLSRLARDDFMLIGTDRRDKDFAWDDRAANVGVFLTLNTPVARHVLREWWHVPLYAPATAREWPPEQRAFNEHVFPRWNRHVRLVPYDILNGRDGGYVRHAVGLGDNPDERVRIIAADCARQGIKVTP